MVIVTPPPPRRPDLEDWARFARLEGHVLSHHPALLFQQAANQPASSAPARAVDSACIAGRRGRPWFRWVNKPRERDPVLFTLRGDHSVTGSTFMPDGQRILTFGGGVRFWDAGTGALLYKRIGHPHAAVFALSKDGRRVATAVVALTLPPEVRVWDLETEEPLGTLNCGPTRAKTLAFSPDGRRLAVGAEDRNVWIWDLESLQSIHHFQFENRPHVCVFSPGGTWLAVSGRDWTHHYDVELWDVESGTKVMALGHEKAAFASAFSPDGTRLVTASDDTTLRIWDLTTGRTVHTLKGHTMPVRSCDWSPDGQRIVSGGSDKSVRLWDADSGESLGILIKHTGGVLSCGFSPDGRRIVSNDQGTAHVWDATARAVEPPPRHAGQVSSAAFSPDGARLATTSYDGTVRLWDVESGGEAATLPGLQEDFFYDCAFAPDGRTLAVASHLGLVVLWDVESGREVGRGRVSESHAHACSFSPDGRRLAAGGLWALVLWDVSTFRPIHVIPNERWIISACPFSPDGSRVADSLRQIWDVATGERVLVLGGGEPEGVSRCAFAPDGSRIVTTWGKGLRLWDAATGAEIMSLGGHSDDTVGCAFTSDGRWVVSTSKAGTLVIHDAGSGAEAARFHAGGGLLRVDANRTHVGCGDAGGVVYLLELMGFESG